MNYKPRSLFPAKKRFSPDFVFQGEGVSFFYTYIRKNASTSFKKLFKVMHPGLCPGDIPSLACMAKYALVKDLTPEEIDQSFANKVFIYRDPIDRAFSVYKNKLIQQDGAEDLLARLSKSVQRDAGLLTFDDFVNEYVSLLETDRWEEVDGHLYPQSWHLLPITYNKVITMDSLYTEMQGLLPKELCDEVFLEPTNSTTKGTVPLAICDADCPAVYFQRKYAESKSLPTLEQILTPSAEARLREIYADDYRILEWNSVVGESESRTPQQLDNARRLLVRLETKKHEYKVACEKISELTAQVAIKDKECKAARDTIEQLQQTVQDQEASLDNLQARLASDNHEGRLCVEIEAHELTRNKLAELAEQCVKTERALQQAQLVVAGLEEKVSAENEAHESTRNKLTVLAEQLEATEQAYQRTQLVVSTLEEKLSVDNESTQNKISVLAQQLEATEQAYQRAQLVVSSLEEKISAENEAHESTRNQLAQQLEATEQAFQQARLTIAKLEEQVCAESAAHTSTRDHVVDLVRKLESSEAAADLKSAEIEELLALLEAEKKAHADARNLLKKVSGDLKVSKESSAVKEQELLSKVKALEGKVVQLEQLLANSLAAQEKLKNSARYQAGYHLVMAGKSVRGFARLPLALWRLAKNKRGQKKTQPLVPQQVAVEKKIEIEVKPEPVLAIFQHPEVIELVGKDPVWHKFKVNPGQFLSVSAAVEYRNVKGDAKRKAVILFKSFDAAGVEVEKECGKVVRSGHLKAFFKYLPCTQNQVQELHEFTVPAGVVEIHLGLCGFNRNDQEQVFISELMVKPKFKKMHAVERFTPPSAQAAAISILGWPEYPPNGKPYVLGIMDEFTSGCFEGDVNLIQPRPDNWYGLAEKYKPELIFIESAWKGNQGSWQYRVAEYANKPGQEVAQICQYAREKGIPTLFWNKEDPVHHDKFMCTAKLVDHIFTTDASMKDSYRVKTGNQSVHALPFAAQPALHKPAPLAGRKPLSCFAGSWYGNRHAERGQAMRWLLEAANKHGLEIYDRNHGTGIFPFPEEYQAGIKGSLPYKELCDEYSRYRVFLNVNSVTESPTMFSRRVFELMACGTPIVSTYAQGIANLFDSGAVWLVHSQEEADAAIHTLMTDDAEWRRRSLAGIREVFAKHTYAHRLNDIFEQLGIQHRMPIEPGVVLLAGVHSQAELDVLNQFANEQTYRCFRLGVECPQGIAAMAGHLSDKIVLLQPGQKNAWIAERQADYPIAGWLSPNSHYGEHYLRDLANASLYEPDASGWAKALNRDLFAYGEQAALCSALWKTAEFLEHYINTKPDALLSRLDLYLADSTQFQKVRLVGQQAVGVKV